MVSTLCVSGSAVVITVRFGPNSPFTAHHVQSICDAKEIPHIETRWDYRVGPIREQYSINLYPYPPTLSKVGIAHTNRPAPFTFLHIFKRKYENLYRVHRYLSISPAILQHCNIPVPPTSPDSYSISFLIVSYIFISASCFIIYIYSFAGSGIWGFHQ